MTSAERVIEYIDLKPEESPLVKNVINLPPHWPQGAIAFDNLSFRYSSTGSWVLKNIQLAIRPTEKVKNQMKRREDSMSLSSLDWNRRSHRSWKEFDYSIVVSHGWTGRSNSDRWCWYSKDLSLRPASTHLDYSSGSHSFLREMKTYTQCSCLSQDPVLFNDTLRINLDPFSEYSDIEIWNALDEVGSEYWIRTNSKRSIDRSNWNRIWPGVYNSKWLKEDRISVLDNDN